MGGSEAAFEFSVDLRSGGVIGRSQDSNPPPGDLGESMANAIGGAFDGPFKEAASGIEQAAASGKHVDAAQVFLGAPQTSFFIPNRHSSLLCGPGRQIDPKQLDPKLRLDTLRLRCNVAGAAHAFDSQLRKDIEWLLGEFAADISPAERVNLELARGLVELNDGLFETALATFESVAASPQANDATRAWAYRNLSLEYDVSDPRSSGCARQSADLFLTIGERVEAARSLRRYAKCVLADSPDRAIKALNDVLAWLPGDDISAIRFRAGVLHVRANALLKIGRADASLADAQAAAELLKGLHGCLPEYAAVLALAVTAGSAANDPALDSISREAEAACARLEKKGVSVRARLSELIPQSAPVAVENLRQEAKASGDWKLEGWAHLCLSIHEPDSLSRIQNAERALSLWGEHNAGDDDLSLGHFALARALVLGGMKEQATGHLRTALRLDPLNHDARHEFVALLADLKKWPEMIDFLEKELERHGDKPGLLTTCAQACLKVGDATRACSLARRALCVVPTTDPKREAIQQLVNEAIDAGGTIEPVHHPSEIRVVTSEEFERCLDDYRVQISGQQRKGFWRRKEGGNGHEWILFPEKRAQELLHTAISIGLGRGRADVIEEFSEAGAGRADLFVSAGPAFRCIVELKMLGAGYTTSYAFSGKEQIVHYMQNRGVHLGYLVIIDGRAGEKNSKGLEATEIVGRSTVRVIFVDVRPTVRG